MEKYYLYAHNNNIISRPFVSGPFTSQTTLATDFLSDLSYCSHNNIIYYAYINTDNRLSIKNTLSSVNLYDISSVDGSLFVAPHISIHDGVFLLTYSLYTPADNKYMPKLFYLKNSPLEIDFAQKDASLTSAYEELLKEKDAIIDNIKLQYDNLMDIANKYRDEAHKWYRKYIDRS